MSAAGRSRTTHRIDWTISRDFIDGTVTCSAEVGAFCRSVCAEPESYCEEWSDDGHLPHGLKDSGYCNVVTFIENADSVQDCYVGPMHAPLRSGPIVAEWQDSWYGWRYADADDASDPDSVSLGPSSPGPVPVDDPPPGGPILWTDGPDAA